MSFVNQLRFLIKSLIESILLFSSEVWGFENIDLLERVHLKFLKNVLSVRDSTTKFMVYEEKR
jgi:hypothetical protein